MSLLKEFKEFAAKGNIVDLAVAVIIGGAFGKIVTSLVSDIVMPLVNPLIPGGNWKEAVVGPGIKIGSFIGTVVDFLIIAWAIFLMIKLFSTARSKDKEAPAPPPPPTLEEKLLTDIRDLLKKQAFQFSGDPLRDVRPSEPVKETGR